MRGIDNQPVQDLHDNMSTLLIERVQTANSIELLSDSNGKILEVVEDDAGKFVRRRYSESGIRDISGLADFDNFQEAWDYFLAKLKQAGLEPVPSFIVEEEHDGYPITVVSEHLDQLVQISELPTAGKVRVARACAKLIAKNDDGHLIQPQAIQHDMFHATAADNGEFSIFLTDIDPYLIKNRLTLHGYSLGIAKQQITRFIDLFYTHWCTDEDREEVLGAFEVALHEELGDSIEENMDLLMVVAKIGTLKYGVEV